MLTRAKVPITDKQILKIIHSRPRDFHMRIAPVKLAGLIDIPVAYIDAANKTGATIHNNYFTVITIIYPVGQYDKYDLIERERLDTGIYQFINKFVPDGT